MVPPLPCPPMSYSDAMTHGLQVKHGRHTVLGIMIVEPKEKLHVDIELHTIIVCQHVIPIHTGPTASIADARLQ